MNDNCKLKMLNMAYNNFKFNRLGQKNDNDADIKFEIDIKKLKHTEEQNIFKVSLSAHVKKEDEYHLDITLNGHFEFDEPIDEAIDHHLKQSSIAILMPYLRAQLSLLTAQPNTDCIVVPPFDISALIENSTHTKKILKQNVKYHLV